MKPILAIALTLMMICSPAIAGVWISPTEKRYGEKFPDLYEDFLDAKELIDSYRGRQSILVEAKQILDYVIKVQIDFAPAYREYARLYYKAGYINDKKWKPQTLTLAKAAIKRAIELAPNYEDAYVLLGYHYTLKGMYKSAEETLDKAEKLGSKSPWLYLNRVPIYKKAGDKDSVARMHIKVVESDTDNRNALSGAMQGLAEYYAEKGDFEQADYWFKEHIDFDPVAWNFGAYAYHLLFDRGDAERSIKYGEKALAEMNYGVGRFNLGCAYYLKWATVMASDGKQEAQPFLDRAYDLNPNILKVVRIFSQNSRLADAGERLREYVLEN